MRKTLLALAALLTSSSAFADTIIYNVNGIQVGPDGRLQRFGGIVIDDQGKVEELIQRSEDLKRPIEHEIDGGGRTLLPGLIDAHGHVVALGFAALQLDLTGTKSLSDLQQRLKAYAAANPNARWILGRGWNQELWAEKRFPTAADLDAALAKAQELMMSNGLTAAADMGTSPEEWEAMNRAGQAGKLNTRILSYAGGMAGMRGINGGKPSEWLYADRLHLGGVKIYADGALGSRGAYLKLPYHDKPDTRGLQFLTDAQMLEQANAAASAGYQPAIHAIGDAANAQVISTYEKLARQHPGDRRWRIEHFQIVDPADIPRLKPAGIIASMQPTHQTSDRLMAEARLGQDRLKGAYAWQTIEKLDIPMAFGSDFPVESPNPFPGLAAAISRQDPNGQPPGGWIPEERVSFEQALAGFTRGAAYAGFAESKFGSLDVGKWADFILVDRDVSAVDPQALGQTQVLETWVAGKKVWAKKSGASAERER